MSTAEEPIGPPAHRLPARPASRNLQQMFNEGVAAEKEECRRTFGQDPLHFDYVDSDEPSSGSFGVLHHGVREQFDFVRWQFARSRTSCSEDDQNAAAAIERRQSCHRLIMHAPKIEP